MNQFHEEETHPLGHTGGCCGAANPGLCVQRVGGSQCLGRILYIALCAAEICKAR